jgi:hypothetical protein
MAGMAIGNDGIRVTVWRAANFDIVAGYELAALVRYLKANNLFATLE